LYAGGRDTLTTTTPRPAGKPGRKRENMNRYAIVIDGKIVDCITAEDAESAADAYSDEMGLDSEFGFVRRVKMIDADTRGREWAIIETDGGDITAERI
jgi:hypothetical protein